MHFHSCSWHNDICQNATWSINSLKVYRKQLLVGNGTLSAAGHTLSDSLQIPKIILPILVMALLGSVW